jgi:Ring finger domain
MSNGTLAGANLQEMECVICTETATELSSLNGCIHMFHANCILSWCKQSSTCPCCRSEIEYVFDTQGNIHNVEHVKPRTAEQDYVPSEASDHENDPAFEPEDSAGSLAEFVVDDQSSSDDKQSSSEESLSSSSSAMSDSVSSSSSEDLLWLNPPPFRRGRYTISLPTPVPPIQRRRRTGVIRTAKPGSPESRRMDATISERLAQTRRFTK